MNILYAEDERALSMAITEILKMEGYTVDAVYDGAEALEHLGSNSYDAAVLDIMMPKTDGIEVLKQMRARDDFTPVLLLTAKSEADDRIAGLSEGADDYLGKPFVAGELVARLNAMIRRTTHYRARLYTAGNITLDCESYELKSNIGSLILSSKESQLLSLFMQNKSAHFSAAELLEKVWSGSKDANIAALYISYLQNKLTQIGATVNIKKSQELYYLGEVQ